MNGPHDLGGMMGFGPINPEANEPVFHYRWEAHMFGVEILFAGDGMTLDAGRHQHEKIPPPQYLNMTYYEKWLTSLEKRVLSHGIVTEAELASGISAGRPAQTPSATGSLEISKALLTRNPYTRSAAAPAHFSVGDRVKTRNIHPKGHTRLPRYARGHVGVIERVNGCMVFPDSNAHGGGEDPRWCYGVRFDGRELWGSDADPMLSVSLDLWEPYLEAD